MRKIILLSIFAIFCRSMSTTTLPNHNVKKNATPGLLIINKIIDLFLGTITDDSVQSVPLGDITKQLKKDSLLFPTDGEFILNNGKMRGMDTVKRYDSEASLVFNGTEISVDFAIQIGLLNFSYDFKVGSDTIFSRGTINGNLTQLISDANMLIDTNEKIIKSIKLRLVKAKSLIVQVDHQSYDFRYRKYVPKLVSNFKAMITTRIEEELQRLLERSIPSSS